MSNLTAVERLKALNGRRFSAAQVCFVTDIPPKSLTNWQSLNKVFLVSATPGRGRPREYCLVDVYILGLVAKIVDITNAPMEGVKVARMRTLDPVFSRELPKVDQATRDDFIAAQEKIFPQLCKDIFVGERWMFERGENGDAYLLLLPRVDEKGKLYASLVVYDPDWNELTDKAGVGAFINLTKMCREIDERLYVEIAK